LSPLCVFAIRRVGSSATIQGDRDPDFPNRQYIQGGAVDVISDAAKLY
jgi:hypothetical protein